MEDKYYKKYRYLEKSMAHRIEALSAELGYVINIENLDVPKKLFPEEYKTLRETYLKVINKIILKNKEEKT